MNKKEGLDDMKECRALEKDDYKLVFEMILELQEFLMKHDDCANWLIQTGNFDRAKKLGSAKEIMEFAIEQRFVWDGK